MEDVSGGGATPAQSAEAQKMLVGESGAGVTSQAAAQGIQPVVSSEVQPQQQSAVTQSGEDNQVSFQIWYFQPLHPPPPKYTIV